MATRSFHRIGVAANLDKEQALALLPDILPALAEDGFEVFVESALSDLDELELDAPHPAPLVDDRQPILL